MSMAAIRRAALILTATALLLGVSPSARSTSPASVGGSVYQDLNRNRVRDGNEAGFAGVQVLLFDGNGAYVASDLTDDGGSYVLLGLAAGPYQVEMAAPAWWDLREDWAPTTTTALYPRISLNVTDSSSADFGWRPISRSRTLGAPISSFVGPNGLRVESYNDVVPAQELYESVMGGLVGAEAHYVVVRFDWGPTSTTVASVLGGPGWYSEYQAVSYVSYLTWLDDGDMGLSHEYGHAWSLYYSYIVQQDATLASYLEARGLAGDPRVNSTYMWSAREMIAEDYRQLLGSPTARSAPQMNRAIPAAADVPGLAEFLGGPFTHAADPPPPPPLPTLSVSAPAVTPSPVTKQAAITFSLSAAATVTVEIRKPSGGVVRTLLASSARVPGSVTVTWNRKDQAGRRVRAGQYVAAVEAFTTSGQQASNSTTFVVA